MHHAGMQSHREGGGVVVVEELEELYGWERGLHSALACYIRHLLFIQEPVGHLSFHLNLHGGENVRASGCVRKSV